MRPQPLTRTLCGLIAALIAVTTPAFVPTLAGPWNTAYAATRSAARPWMPAGTYRFIGHRGYPRGGHTENTLPAIRAARRAGATAVEVDIHRTRDRKLVLMHDPTMHRTTTCRGKVRRMRYAQIRRHCRGERHHERIPQLWRAVRYTHLHHMSIIIEVKPDAVGSWGPGLYRKLGHAIAARHMKDRAFVLSRSPAVLHRFRRQTHGIPTSWIERSGWPGVRRASRTADILQVKAYQLTRPRVRALHRSGTAVIARRTNSARSWRHVRRTDADSVLVDDLPRYVRWTRSH